MMRAHALYWRPAPVRCVYACVDSFAPCVCVLTIFSNDEGALGIVIGVCFRKPAAVIHKLRRSFPVLVASTGPSLAGPNIFNFQQSITIFMFSIYAVIGNNGPSLVFCIYTPVCFCDGGSPVGHLLKSAMTSSSILE